jgi:hypothetical protein
MDSYISDFFNTRLEARYNLITSLANCQYWRGLLIELCNAGFKISGSTISGIENNHNTPYSRAEATMDNICGRGVTVRVLVAALQRIGLQVTADSIESIATGRLVGGGYQVAGAPVYITNNSIFSSPHQVLAQDSPLVASPPINSFTSSGELSKEPSGGFGKIKTSVRKRLVQDSSFYVVKVPLYARMEDGDSMAATLLFCKDKQDALREANLQYRRDLKVAGGKEEDLSHGYVVGSFLTWHGPGEEEIKNVAVELGSKSAK